MMRNIMETAGGIKTGIMTSVQVRMNSGITRIGVGASAMLAATHDAAAQVPDMYSPIMGLSAQHAEWAAIGAAATAVVTLGTMAVRHFIVKDTVDDLKSSLESQKQGNAALDKQAKAANKSMDVMFNSLLKLSPDMRGPAVIEILKSAPEGLPGQMMTSMINTLTPKEIAGVISGLSDAGSQCVIFKTYVTRLDAEKGAQVARSIFDSTNNDDVLSSIWGPEQRNITPQVIALSAGKGKFDEASLIKAAKSSYAAYRLAAAKAADAAKHTMILTTLAQDPSMDVKEAALEKTLCDKSTLPVMLSALEATSADLRSRAADLVSISAESRSKVAQILCRTHDKTVQQKLFDKMRSTLVDAEMVAIANSDSVDPAIRWKVAEYSQAAGKVAGMTVKKLVLSHKVIDLPRETHMEPAADEYSSDTEVVDQYEKSHQEFNAVDINRILKLVEGKDNVWMTAFYAELTDELKAEIKKQISENMTKTLINRVKTAAAPVDKDIADLIKYLGSLQMNEVIAILKNIGAIKAAAVISKMPDTQVGAIFKAADAAFVKAMMSRE